MSRNFIKSVEEIFEYLESEVESEDKQRIITAEKRIICPPPPDKRVSNQRIFSNVNIKSSILISNKESVYGLGLSLEQKSYILIPGISELEDGFSPGFLRKVSNKDDLADGLKLLAMSQKLISLKPDNERSLRLIDRVFGLSTNESKEVHYDVEQIASFYREFEVWEIDPSVYEVDIESDLYRLYIIWRINNEKDQGEKHGFALNFSHEALEQLVKLSVNQNSKYVSKVLYRAMTATNWEHCYLELYRCIENLYTVYHIDYLKERLDSNTRDIASSLEGMEFKSREVYDVSKIFEKIELNHHLLRDLKENVFTSHIPSPKIDVSQGVLLRLKEAVIKNEPLDEDLLNKLNEEFNKVKSSDDNLLKTSREMAEKLYQIRCSIAHLKYRHNHISYSESQWQRIIFSVLSIIEELYNLYGIRLEELS